MTMTPAGGRSRGGRGVRVRAAAGLACAALAALQVGQAKAQSRRGPERSRELPQPERSIAFSDAETRCSAAYGDALAGIMSRPGAQPLATVKRIRSALPAFRGYFLFQEGGERRRLRDAQNRIVDGDRVCEEQISHAGRTKCLKWAAREPEPPREPPLPTPPMSKDEAKLSKQLAEFVQNKGAPPEFLSNGKYTIMSERVAGDLESYLTQPPHAALCTGAEEFLEFLDDQLPLLRKRAGDVAEMEPLARALAGSRIADLQAFLSAATTQGAAVATGAVAADPAAPVAPVAVASALAGTAMVASMTLTPAEATAVKAEKDALAALARAAAAIGSDAGSALSAAQRAQARAAYRTLELAAYAEQLVQRYRELDAALFGNITAARKAHGDRCNCGG